MSSARAGMGGGGYQNPNKGKEGPWVENKSGAPWRVLEVGGGAKEKKTRLLATRPRPEVSGCKQHDPAGADKSPGCLRVGAPSLHAGGGAAQATNHGRRCHVTSRSQ